MVLAFVSDLIFRSKIREAAAQRGQSVQFIGALPEDASPQVIIFDLNAKSGNVFDAIKSAKNRWPNAARVCYGSHVDTELFAAAEAAGATEIFARSRFIEELPLIIGS